MRRAALGVLLAVTGCDRVFGLERSPDAPPPPPPPAEWTAVVAGSAHSCGLHTDGTLWCWGENGTGQLGLPPPTVETVAPVQISLGHWKALASGNFHTCAISVEGELWCWGSNQYNAIGTDTPANPLPVTRVLDNVTAVATGSEHTCAIRGDQSLWCWGRGTEGQLGIDPGQIVATPRDASNGRTWKTIAAGGRTTCGITTADELLCWGANQNAQIQVPPSPLPQSTPVAIESGVVWTDVSIGILHTCALRGDGTLRCSGFNGLGQLGTAATNTTVTIGTGEPGRTWVRVFAGYFQTCALRDDATLWCLGANSQMQLALDTSEPRVSIPTQVKGGGEAWTSFAIGESHLCGIDEAGALWCAGNNGSGQIGDGSGGSRLTPTQVPGAWWNVAVGYYSACARDFPDGTLWCWGLNTSSQLGDGTAFSYEAPMRITSGKIDDPIGMGQQHSCSTRSAIDTTLTCFGANGSGQLGTGMTTNGSSLPVAVSPAITNADEIAAGTHTCVHGSDGLLRCWGSNSHGQLSTAPDVNPHPSPAVIPGSFSAVAAGLQHTCVVTAGNVYCFGDNAYLQRGTTMTPGLGYVGPGAKVILGRYHSCLITTTNDLRCWGANFEGQLGDGTVANRAAPTPVDGYWQQVSAGRMHTCGLHTDGSLWCWGDNARGQLGDGTHERQLAPKQVGLAIDWDRVAAGGDETCAIKDDHTLWCWGANGAGQIGDGSAWSPTFVRIAP